MRILFVATIFSPIAARWINQVVIDDWDIHVYGTSNGDIHPLFHNVTIYTQLPRNKVADNIKFRSAWRLPRGDKFLKWYLPKLGHIFVPEPGKHIAKLITQLKPDIIHTLKMQSEAYYVDEARQLLGGELPCPWIYSMWGSDIYDNQNSDFHRERIRSVLTNCDYLMADNPRDIELAKSFGFKRGVLGVFPGGGGYEVKQMQRLITQHQPSQRNIIALKGYQSERGGKVLHALEALKLLGNVITGYKIVIHSALNTYASQYLNLVQKKAYEVSQICNVSIEFLPFSPIETIWELFGKSRIAIGISSTDGTPNAMLEAIIMGAYPIQSNTDGLDNWIDHPKNGALVAYNKIEEIAFAIQTALENDELVDNAAHRNYRVAAERLDRDTLRQEIIDIYQSQVK